MKTLSFSDIFMRETTNGRGVEIVVKRPLTVAHHEELENYDIFPRGGWKRGMGNKSPYSTQIKELIDVNSSFFYARIQPGGRGYRIIKRELDIKKTPLGNILLLSFGE